MTPTLITGANKGLGKHAARRSVASGHTVFVGSRDVERGRAAAEEIGARMVLIDVTSDESVAAAATLLRDEVGQFDVLINNAGIAGGRPGPIADVTAADVWRVTARFSVRLRAPQPRSHLPTADRGMRAGVPSMF